MTVVAVLALAHQCAPTVAPETIVSIAKAESGLNPLAIHDNATGQRYMPAAVNEAVTLATGLIAGEHHNIDLGLMQINSANLAASNLRIADAFDACHSIEVGARILSDAFQRALRSALSTYNTGDQQRGIDNGYVARVEAAATTVPAIAPAAPVVPQRMPAAPSGVPTGVGWDVFAESSGTRFVFTSGGATANAR
jgi:type IV secretion system protein VirB1